MNRDEVLETLQTNGYVVIPDVMTTEECDEYAGSYIRWYSNIPKVKQRRSLIQSYRVGHFNSSWKIRLKVKPVFEMLWGTKKLLTSVDGIAVSAPPEMGNSDFRKDEDCWLHIDQGCKRRGLHAYQGAVYLEETKEDDYCFRVLKGSHKYHTEFFQSFPNASDRSLRGDHEFYKLNPVERAWYIKNGCQHVCAPVPKGGIVLWDSRTVHDSLAPSTTRSNKDRWRCVCFVSMTPAIWAGRDDIEFKQKVYADLALTTHWSSQGQRRFTDDKYDDVLSIRRLPQIAKSREVKLMMGVDNYDFHDGKPNGPPTPAWE